MTRRHRLDIESYVNDLARTVVLPAQPTQEQESVFLESALKGMAVELWSNAAGRLFIVADDDDARRLNEPRGTVYTAAEVRRMVRIGDPDVVREIHEWKRTFDGRIEQETK